MAKIEGHIDVLVLGGHPCAYLAAALLRHKSKFRILHATIPDERLADRLVLVNPALYSLHPLLDSIKRKVEARPVYGLRFLSDDVGTTSEYRSRTIMSCITRLKDLRNAAENLAETEEVEFATPRQFQIHRIDENGLEVTLNGQPLHPKALVLAGFLSSDQQRLLGLPEDWESGIVHRYTFAKIRPGRLLDLSSRPLVPMSLDLRRMLCWAWLLPGAHYAQLAVEQPLDTVAQVRGLDLLNHWACVLHAHGVLKAPLEIAPEHAESIAMPLGGALAHEGLANRTLLIGPAGGFYSASGEDMYPNCWSALFAADVLRKALKEQHLQDALQPYRQRWRTTLGDYLRGPQQNLRFLLPLIYRNQVMTTRLAEAILIGKSVVR